MKKSWLVLVACSTIISCKKNESSDLPTPPPSGFKEYMPLQVGNYWVYNVYSEDTLGNKYLIDSNDTITVVGDTIIDSLTYFVLKSSKSTSQLFSPTRTFYYQNIAGELVTPDKVLLSQTQDTLKSLGCSGFSFDPSCKYNLAIYSKRNDYASCPLGVFPTATTMHWVQDKYGTEWNASFRDVYIRRGSYAEKIGRIRSECVFMSNPHNLFSQELVAYYIQ